MSTDNPTHNPSSEQMPTVQVRRQRWPSPVWLIPLAAALVGCWLLFQYWAQKGDVITVRFPSAEGIEAGNTLVRYKAVTVGKVKSVTLDDKLEPLITLDLSKDISDELACSAQFWVVRPRVRGAEISGLGTLFSGTYIGMAPSRQEDNEITRQSLLCYEVLEEPPVAKPTRPGRELTLISDSIGSLDIGTPIFYKKLQVGEIYDYSLLTDSGNIELKVFIDDPYYRFINGNTRFWNVSGVDLKVSSTGAEVHMESLTSLLIGGVAFDTPEGQPGEAPVSRAGSVFELYPDLASSQEKRYNGRLYYTLYFNGSIRGLAEGASVEYQGIRVGQVEKIKMHLATDTRELRIPVLISIEPQRFSEEILLEEAPALLEDMVGRGMRAKLQNGNLLTGQMYVALGFDENPKPATITKGQFSDTFPTSPTPVEELSKLAIGAADDLKATLESIRRFMESDQLDKTVDNVNLVLTETGTTVADARKAILDVRELLQAVEKQTLPALNGSLSSVSKNVDAVSGTLNRSLTSVTKNVDSVSGTLNRSLTSASTDLNKVTGNVNTVTGTVGKAGNDFGRTSVELTKTLQRLQGTLTHMDRIMAQNSPTQHQLLEMLEEVTTMSRSVRTLTDTLQKQPEALIRGKGN